MNDKEFVENLRQNCIEAAGQIIETYRLTHLQEINDEFGLDAGFEERRQLASEVAQLQRKLEEL